jgi:drug/metabolite transporter (DMT)-like permease
MLSIRFSIAGVVMITVLIWRKAPLPTWREWLGAAILGSFLLIGGNGIVVFAEQWVESGLTAVMVGIMPLYAALFAGFFGRWPKHIEWAGLAVGFSGLVLLNVGQHISANPLGVILLICAPMSWALGTVLSKRLTLPKGGMSSAAQMLCVGVLLLPIALGSGERLTSWPTSAALWAMLFLIVFGSLVAYSSYVYLLSHVRPLLATSYAYVNPIVALALGAVLAGEQLTPIAIVACLVMLAGVVLVTLGKAGK